MFGAFCCRKNMNKISQSDAKARLSAEKNIILLDVRTPEEYREIHIPNSISLPLDQIKTGIAKIAANKETEIFVYCQSGMRAESARRQLSEMGYSKVYNMGGINSWKYETEKGR